VAACTDWQDWVVDQVAELRPDVIVVTADTIPLASGSPEHVDPALSEKVRVGLDETVTALTAYGGRLIMIGDTPGLPTWTGSCLARRGATLLDCALKLDKPWAESIWLTRGIASAHHGDFIDPSSWFCAHLLCPAVVGSMVTYRDAGHVTTAYSKHLSSALGDAMALTTAR
jgi:hypothetical protein